MWQGGIVSDWLENGRGEWRVDALEELEEQDANAEALRRQTVRLGLRHFEDQALGAQFGEVVAQLAQTVRWRWSRRELPRLADADHGCESGRHVRRG